MEHYPDKIACTFCDDLTTVLYFPGIPATCALLIEYPNFNFDIDETRNKSIELVSEILRNWNPHSKPWLATNKSLPSYTSNEFIKQLDKLDKVVRYDGLRKTDFTFYHAGQCSVSELGDHVFFFNGFTHSFFILFPSEDQTDSKSFLSRWHESDKKYPGNIIETSLAMDAMVIFFLGAFDDPAIDTVICGQPEMISSMKQFVQEACEAAN